MADLKKPTRGKKNKKGAVPTLEDASNNITNSKEEVVQLSFKPPKSFVKDFKSFALEQELSLTDLLKQSFAYYRDSHS